jgi:hypothetical protein
MIYHRFATTSVKIDTNYSVETLDYIWNKYNAWNGSPPGSFAAQPPLPPVNSILDRQYYFYCAFRMVHECPKTRAKHAFRSHDCWFDASPRTVRGQVHPLMKALSKIISEVDRSRRLNPYNHGVSPFDYFVTGMVDTFPVYVPAARRFSIARLLYQPKYKDHVLKWQLGITFGGEIILFTGPHLGTTPDCTIWEATWAEHPFFDWEVWLADLGYVGCEGLLYKYKRDGGVALTDRQQFFNNVHEHVRNRIEQIVGVVKQHRMFEQGVYRGSFDLLKACVTVTGHVTAAELRMRPGGPRFVCYGPWDHVY